MKVLVTGGQGFIGRYVVEELLAKGHSVIVLDRHDHVDFGPGVEFMLGDIRDATAVTEGIAHSEGWIHLGGVLGTAETIYNPSPAAETNILGGLNVLEAAAQYKVPGVNIAVGNFWENNTYSITKNTVERFGVMYRLYRDLQVTNLRALNAYGPRQSVAAPFGDSKVRKIMPSFVCRALSGMPIEIYGTGNQIMDMIYVGDVAKSLVAALEYTAEHGAIDHVLEAGSGVDTTVTEIAQAVVKAVGAGQINYIPLRAGETPGAVVLGDPKTLSPLYDYGVDPRQFRTLGSGLESTVKYFREYLDQR